MQYDGSGASNVILYTLTNLSVGRTYTVTVSALNLIGESSKSSLTLIAASVPTKMNTPTLTSATSTQIVIQWTAPTFDGGAAVTTYAVRRDDGPNTAF